MQYASEWRIPAGRSKTGSGATSQSKSLIVRKVGVERRDESSMASRPFCEARLVVLGLDVLVAGDDAVVRAQLQELLQRHLGPRALEREARRPLLIVHELTAVRPDERREPDDRRLDPEPEDRRPNGPQLGIARRDGLALRVARQVHRADDELGPGPAGLRLGHAEAAEQVAVVVDDEAGDVLRQARQHAVPAEGLERLREEVVRLELVRVFDPLLERLQHVPGGELAVEAVVQRGTGRAATPPAKDVESRARRSSRSLASISWTGPASSRRS